MIARDTRAEGTKSSDRLLIARAFARLDALALGIAVGVVSASGLFLLTAALLVQGGPTIGLHMDRLSFFLVGYDVSWGGAVIGLLWQAERLRDGALVDLVPDR